MKNVLEYCVFASPAPAPVKEPTTKPTEPSTSPGKDNDPWNVPSPQVKPTPKA